MTDGATRGTRAPTLDEATATALGLRGAERTAWLREGGPGALGARLLPRDGTPVGDLGLCDECGPWDCRGRIADALAGAGRWVEPVDGVRRLVAFADVAASVEDLGDRRGTRIRVFALTTAGKPAIDGPALARMLGEEWVDAATTAERGDPGRVEGSQEERVALMARLARAAEATVMPEGTSALAKTRSPGGDAGGVSVDGEWDGLVSFRAIAGMAIAAAGPSGMWHRVPGRPPVFASGWELRAVFLRIPTPSWPAAATLRARKIATARMETRAWLASIPGGEEALDGNGG